MNTGIIASAIIGGILMVLIMTFNNRVITDSNQTTLNQIVKDKVSNVSQTMSYDFRRMGYEVNGGAITQANPDEITFKEEYQGSVHTITWLYEPNVAETDTKNPNDHPLYRIVDGVKHQIGASVTSFSLKYRLNNGNDASNPQNLDNIRRIQVSMVFQSPEPYGKTYQTAAWQKVYSPANLQF